MEWPGWERLLLSVLAGLQPDSFPEVIQVSGPLFHRTKFGESLNEKKAHTRMPHGRSYDPRRLVNPR